MQVRRGDVRRNLGRRRICVIVTSESESGVLVEVWSVLDMTTAVTDLVYGLIDVVEVEGAKDLG